MYKVSIDYIVLLVKLSECRKKVLHYKHFLQCKLKSLWNSCIAKSRKLMYTRYRLGYENDSNSLRRQIKWQVYL